MDARRQPDTTETTTPAPAKPKRERGTTTDGVKAGQLFERLQLLDQEELAELAASPADIRRKYQAKRDVALSGASDDVRKLVEKLRA